MATLHKEYNAFLKKVRLTNNRKKKLKKSRRKLRRTIRDWFSENKPKRLQPKFGSQGSFTMNTIINPIPIPVENEDKKLVKYDLDDGIYFIEKPNEDNREKIDTWHDWVYKAVNNHTTEETIRKKTCVRVVFVDGHHIDLPIYYQISENGTPELAHRSKSWIESDPKKFTEWYNEQAEGKPQITRIVQYIKAWKNFREQKNTNLKLPSGFAFTILVVNNYYADNKDDVAFRETVRAIHTKLSNNFECRRPTTPKNEDIFSDFSETKKSNTLETLKNLLKDCDRADEEDNFKTASEFLRDNQFGGRFPKGDDISEREKKRQISESLEKERIKPKPYADER
ncbi:CBASS cGAMP synthase [Kordia algicida OT-1]|uniref:Cyclic GMP-AMP synthase n=1 Tax=Kordia algicida OT-1 TaxID=391587 RepID=A9DMA9_9FLAO|nr:hypothetical protein [Kordia algicida]EDP97665.1 hypothetical protein KAOT1_20922 [Kordia algicida OT-1]